MPTQPTQAKDPEKDRVVPQAPSADDTRKLATRKAIREAHIGLHVIARCIAVYFTLTMIGTFFAEALMNTVRLNKGLSQEGLALLSGKDWLRFFAKFYPDGSTVVQLISADFVIVYLFAVAVFALTRFTYHKLVRDEGIDLHVGGMTWESLEKSGQNFWVRLAWLISPSRGVHMKIFGAWTLYIFFFAVIAAVASLLGVSVYLSPEIKLALYGSGVAFLFGTLDDLKFFKKIPPKEAIVASLVALFEGVKRLDARGTINRLSSIMENVEESGTKEATEVLRAMLAVLEAQEAKRKSVPVTPLQLSKKE